MAKLTLTDLANLQNENTAVAAINANNTSVETALENTLSRDGTTPNQMEAVLDMNSFQIINLPEPATDTAPLRLQDLNDFIGGGTIYTTPVTSLISSDIARAGLGLVNYAATTFVVAPDGVNARIAVSDTSAQLHYDNIVLGTEAASAIVQPPRITWKVPDYDDSNAGLDHPLGNVGGNATAFIVSAGADGPSDGTATLPLQLAAQNTAGTETIHVHIAGGNDFPLIGVGTTNPLNDIQAATIHLHANDTAVGSHIHFSNADTDSTGADGFYVGINASEQPRIWNKEATDIIVGISDTQVGSFKAGGIMDIVTGYRVNGAATSGNYLRGNGTNFVSSAIQSSDIRTAGGVVALGQSSIPFVLVSSGTMGNNGALSGITAVANQYASAYVYLPAAAIEAGSTAGWYYAVFSSTTAATVYNNTYTSGTPSIPGSPTAFATTGPGAYTQTTGSYITAYSLTIPANTIGANGTVRAMGVTSVNNTANAKAIRLVFGGAMVLGATGTSNSVNVAFTGGFSNRGVTNKQVPLTTAGLQYAGTTTVLEFGTVDTTSSQTIVAQLQLVTTATDTAVLENIVVELMPGVA